MTSKIRGNRFGKMTRLWFGAVLVCCVLRVHIAVVCGQTGPQADWVYLFSFFRGNGESGLFLAWSRDGLKWTELKPPAKSFLEPVVGGRLMRDPCLALGPDGTFHLVWTTSWGKPAAFGYANSRDLLDWSEQRAITVMEHEPGVENVWAPELFYNTNKGEWIVFWSSTVPGKFPETAHSGDRNHRIYCTTTKDFITFTQSRLFYDGGFNVIDATMLAARGKFYLIVKDETRNPPKKNLRIAVAESPEGPFGPASPPISTNTWVEGPSAIRIGADYYIFFDHYVEPRYYGAVKSADLEHWQDVSHQVSFPRGARHGTMLRVPQYVIERIQKQANHSTN